MSKDELVLLHFSLGKDIRNAFGLNGDNAVLLGKRCADDVSGDIIEALWEKLSNWTFPNNHPIHNTNGWIRLIGIQ